MKKRILYFIGATIALSISACTESNLPYSQNFDAAAFPPPGCQTFPIGATDNWVRDTTVSPFGKGKACISFNNYSSNPPDGYAGLRMPAMDFSTVQHPYMRLDLAYAERIGDSNMVVSDTFTLWYSFDTTTVDSEWNQIAQYGGKSLAIHNDPTKERFVPMPDQWNTFVVKLPDTLIGKPVLRLAIEDDYEGGNMLYVGNIRVFDSVMVK